MMMAQDIKWDSYYGAGDEGNVADFEKITGYQFPESYKKIVSRFNGAFVVDKDAFKLHSNLTGDEVVLDSGMFLPYGQIEGVSETIDKKNTNIPDGFIDGLLGFSSLGNGDLLCFDYRDITDKEEPAVVVWHHHGSSINDSISLVSENFDGFIDLLFEE